MRHRWRETHFTVVRDEARPLADTVLQNSGFPRSARYCGKCYEQQRVGIHSMSFWTRNNSRTQELERLKEELSAVRERAELLDTSCGVGLWQAVLHNADAFDPKSVWTWSPEFRRLLGYSGEADFPNICQSWSDKLHPDDVARVLHGQCQRKEATTRDVWAAESP